ncbi:MAG TPA: CocE/NonD family hydrolase [Acidimicrobiales bacterium]
MRRAGSLAALLVLTTASLACVSAGGGGGGGGDGGGFAALRRGADPAPWEVRAGVEQITVTGAQPGEPLTLYGTGQRKLITLEADDAGQAHFAYLPGQYAEVASGPDLDYSQLDVPDGSTVEPGRYLVTDDSEDPRLATKVVTVPDRDDVPDTGLYDRQQLSASHLDLLGGPAPGTARDDGYQYLEMRDGVRLSAMVRFPDQGLYGPGPYPTVVEYSGYSPSDPASEEPASRLARAFGYATVSVNLRGTGCSGGVFDVFNPAQMADGYDVIEIVARQDWVAGGKVGMVGLSYSGITQLYVAATNPPHLAAVTPQSVIADPWLEAWPGGIFNAGFTQQWIQARDAESQAGGTDWVSERVAAGDTTCAGNLGLRSQNPDFENLVRSLPTYNASLGERDLRSLVGDIGSPVFLSGAWQDEQTGPQFTAMVDNFDSSDHVYVNLWNGRHPDGFGPVNLMRWYEFLELYVAHRVPHLNPALRAVLPGLLADQMGLDDFTLEPDRFASYGDDVDGALSAYESRQPVRVVFESGLGANEIGEPGGTFEVALDAWPPPDAEPETWYLGADESLTTAEPARAAGGADSFRFDPDAGGATLFGGTGDYPLLSKTWDTDWTRFPAGDELSYLTEPFSEDTVFAGPGYADLYVASDEGGDVNVQVSVSEVRPDGTEVLIQNGWLDLAHRAEDRDRTDGLEIVHPFTERARRPLEPNQVVEARIGLPSFAHPVRAGSRLRLSIATPGRNHGTWEFENPDYGGDIPTQTVARTRAMPSALVLSRLPDVTVPPLPVASPCPGLRGQACRPFVATENPPGELPDG